MSLQDEIWDDDTEILVVGGGGAGLMVALVAANEGARADDRR